MCAYLPQMVTEVATVAKSGFAVVLRDTSAPSRAHRAMRVAASDLGRLYSAAQESRASRLTFTDDQPIEAAA